MKSSANLRHLTRCIVASLIAGLLLLIACISLIQAGERPPTADGRPLSLDEPAVGGPPSPLSDTTLMSPSVKPQAIQEGGLRPATGIIDREGWFPFTIPWDDTTDTPLSAADLLVDYPGQDPATVIDARGHVRAGPDGHFYFEKTGQRAKFWGVNLVGSAHVLPCPDAPPHPDEFPDVHISEKLAAHLAKLGFNALRFGADGCSPWGGSPTAPTATPSTSTPKA